MKSEKVWKILLLPFPISLLIPVAEACTGVYAGKGMTVDGSVLIGRTVDFSPYNATMYQQICERGAFGLYPRRGGAVVRGREAAP